MTKDKWIDTIELAAEQYCFENNITSFIDDEAFESLEIPWFIKDCGEELLENAPYQALYYLGIAMSKLGSDCDADLLDEAKAQLAMCKKILLYIEKHR